MRLKEEIDGIINGEAIYHLSGYLVPGAPPVPDDLTQQFAAIGALLNGHRLALRRIAEVLEDSGVYKEPEH